MDNMHNLPYNWNTITIPSNFFLLLNKMAHARDAVNELSLKVLLNCGSLLFLAIQIPGLNWYVCLSLNHICRTDRSGICGIVYV